MKERLQHAYFTEGLSYSDPDTLVRLSVEVGLDGDETRHVLETTMYAADVHADIGRAQMVGISGVPFFLFDEKYAVSGAQPVELFLMALQRTWDDSHLVVNLAGNRSDSAVCTDENCAL